MTHHNGRHAAKKEADYDFESLQGRLATGEVKPEVQEEMDRFLLRNRQANQESRGGTWE